MNRPLNKISLSLSSLHNQTAIALPKLNKNAIALSYLHSKIAIALPNFY
ncbi:MAG: hypothetical protein VKL42_12760 [Snowella sp.]|nr:hypothetical protein [Snowella sp.]